METIRTFAHVKQLKINKMTSEITNANKIEKPFPKLMANGKMIILATGKNIDFPDSGFFIGTLIHQDQAYIIPLGEYSDRWDKNFHDFDGEITLKS